MGRGASWSGAPSGRARALRGRTHFRQMSAFVGCWPRTEGSGAAPPIRPGRRDRGVGGLRPGGGSRVAQATGPAFFLPRAVVPAAQSEMRIEGQRVIGHEGGLRGFPDACCARIRVPANPRQSRLSAFARSVFGEHIRAREWGPSAYFRALLGFHFMDSWARGLRRGGSNVCFCNSPWVEMAVGFLRERRARIW